MGEHIVVSCPGCGMSHRPDNWFGEINCSCAQVLAAHSAARAQQARCKKCGSLFRWSDSTRKTGELVISRTTYHIHTVHCPKCDALALYGPPEHDPPWVWGSALGDVEQTPPPAHVNWGSFMDPEPSRWRQEIMALDGRFRAASHFLKDGRLQAL